VFQDIPQSAYFRDYLDNDLTGERATRTSHAVQIFQPLPGTYSVVLSGLPDFYFGGANQDVRVAAFQAWASFDVAERRKIFREADQ
jgi:hypothetical protein